MKKVPLFVFFSLAITGLGFAQTTAATDPVGFVSVTIPAHTDACLAVPLNRPSVFQGVIQSISGNVITLAGTPGWTANQFVQNLGTQNETYSVLIATGTSEGMIAKITSNGTNTVTVTLDSGDTLSGIQTVAANGAGDSINILPYWTPIAMFPTGIPDGTEILGFESSTAGVNLSASQLYARDGNTWVDEILGPDVSNTPMAFGQAFILRNNSNSGLPVSLVGSVPMASFRHRLATLASNKDQDIRFGFLSPVPEQLTSLNIPAVTGDQIFVIDNTAVGLNKSASQILVFDTGTWYDGVTGDPVPSTYTLTPAYGYIFRKFATASPQSVVWQKLQSYLQ